MINNYSLGTTLGTGFSAKVKLAKDQNNSDVALKIFDLNNPMVDKGLLDLVKTEFQATQSMDHRNIVKYYEYCEKAEYVKKDGKERCKLHILQWNQSWAVSFSSTWIYVVLLMKE